VSRNIVKRKLLGRTTKVAQAAMSRNIGLVFRSVFEQLLPHLLILYAEQNFFPSPLARVVRAMPHTDMFGRR